MLWHACTYNDTVNSRGINLDKLISAFWGMCRLKVAPQDLPVSSVLLGLAIAAYAVTSLFAAALQLPFEKAVLAAALDVGLLGTLSYLVLWIRMLTPRWTQTMTALAGTGAVIAVFMLPFIFWQANATTSETAFVPTVALLGCMIWDMFIIGHIMRHALNVPMLLGGTLAAVYIYISWRVFSVLLFTTPR